jgi:hypothetical protein
MKRTLIFAAAFAALSFPAQAQIVPDGPPGQDPPGNGHTPDKQSPTPNLDSAATGRSEVNAQTSGCYQAREPSRTCDQLASRHSDRDRDWHQTDEK